MIIIIIIYNFINIEIEISQLKEELKVIKEKERSRINNKKNDNNKIVSKTSSIGDNNDTWNWIGLFFTSSKPTPTAILRV